MPQLATIQQQFHDDLDRARDLLELIRKFKAFAGSAVPVQIANGMVSWAEAADLTSIAPQVRTDLPLMSGSILLYVCGRFENFVREVVMAVGDEYATKASSYAVLPESVRSELLNRTLEVAKSPTKYHFKESDTAHLIKVLSDSLNPAPGAPVVVETRLLAITDANMHSRMFAEIFKRVGMDNVWQELGKQAPLKAHLGETADAQCRSAATARIDAIMRERNGIAHPTASTSFPDPDQVQDVVEFLRVLSKVAVDLALIPRGPAAQAGDA